MGAASQLTDWRCGPDKVLNNAKEDKKTQISMSLLLLKAESYHVAMLSDANAVRTKKAPELAKVACLKIASRQLVRVWV